MDCLGPVAFAMAGNVAFAAVLWTLLKLLRQTRQKCGFRMRRNAVACRRTGHHEFDNTRPVSELFERDRRASSLVNTEDRTRTVRPEGSSSSNEADSDSENPLALSPHRGIVTLAIQCCRDLINRYAALLVAAWLPDRHQHNPFDVVAPGRTGCSKFRPARHGYTICRPSPHWLIECRSAGRSVDAVRRHTCADCSWLIRPVVLFPWRSHRGCR